MQLFNGGEDVGRFGRDDAALGERVGKNIQHDLGVRGGVQVALVVLVDVVDDLADVGQVAVVREDDAVRGVHVEGLGFGDGGAAGGGITDVADAHIAEQTGHVGAVEDVGDEAVFFVEVEAILVTGGDAGRVLSPMLQHGKRVIDDAADRMVSEDADDPAHNQSLPATALWSF